MKKILLKATIVALVILVLLVVVYFLRFIIAYRPSYEGSGPEMTAQECWDSGGKVLSARNEGSGCLTKKDFLGVVTDMLCQCACCRDRFWNF
jgi:hypothetical protein